MARIGVRIVKIQFNLRALHAFSNSIFPKTRPQTKKFYSTFLTQFWPWSRLLLVCATIFPARRVHLGPFHEAWKKDRGKKFEGMKFVLKSRERREK